MQAGMYTLNIKTNTSLEQSLQAWIKRLAQYASVVCASTNPTLLLYIAPSVPAAGPFSVVEDI